MIVACNKYGFVAPSGRRNSNRPGPGTRTIWVRLLPVHVTVFGAQVAPEVVRGDADDGTVRLEVGTQALPQGSQPVAVSAGQTWYFQLWYRDALGGSTSNFTNSLRLLFI